MGCALIDWRADRSEASDVNALEDGNEAMMRRFTYEIA